MKVPCLKRQGFFYDGFSRGLVDINRRVKNYL
jgi:hypothetical protein